jgi:hypothetical protein
VDAFYTTAPPRGAFLCMARFNEPIEPMTLGNMRANGVRSLAVSCHKCHHETVINADKWSGQMLVPSFGSRMVCTKCGTVGADVRPNWRERER